MKNELRRLIEEADWYVTKVIDGYELSKFSPAGEDFYISLSEATLLEDIRSECDNYDADEHAEMWMEHRGTCGVPESVRELIEDADAIGEMLHELKDIIEGYFDKDKVIEEKKKPVVKHVTVKDDPDAETRTKSSK